MKDKIAEKLRSFSKKLQDLYITCQNEAPGEWYEGDIISYSDRPGVIKKES